MMMLGIHLQPHSELTLARQIYQRLKDLMIEGELAPGEVLPSTRELAKALGISRNTTYEAYEMLAAEGYITTRPGSKTQVAQGLQLERAHIGDNAPKESVPAPKYRVNFRSGQPDLRHFPRNAWFQRMERAAQSLPLEEWGYTGPDGLPQLREEIASWLFRSRGIQVSSSNIFITAGATQALCLLMDLISRDGQGLLVEDPCHMGMLRVLQGKGIAVHPVPVDRFGIKTNRLDLRQAFGIYLTPSHQFPLGGILPAERRATLIRLAREEQLYLIEDDYDSEFRYVGPPIAPLYSMDPERVIYVGTFSKILFPSLRIGYIILPPPLHKPWRYLRTHADVQNPPFEQAALADYLSSRKLDRHIQQMRKIYGQRRKALIQRLETILDLPWNVWGDAAGLHLVLEFPGRRFTDEFSLHCKEAGLYIALLENHCIKKGVHEDKLVLGYGHLTVEEIEEGIGLLNECLRSFP